SMCKDEDFDLLWEAISKLSDLEQYVISRRFGLHGISASNLDHISTALGVSSRSVRVIEKRALSRLREIMSLDNLSSRVQ
ncbi:MAG: sigma factor-like helix-turn-helix DNA-binding protein, partial [Thermoguttaceae bacterium]